MKYIRTENENDGPKTFPVEDEHADAFAAQVNGVIYDTQDEAFSGRRADDEELPDPEVHAVTDTGSEAPSGPAPTPAPVGDPTPDATSRPVES